MVDSTEVLLHLEIYFTYKLLSDKLNNMSDKMWTQTTTNDTIKEDSIVEAIRTQLKDRSDVGIRKYNTTLDRTDLSLLDWLEHAKQEALDFALYLERIKREVKEKGLDG